MHFCIANEMIVSSEELDNVLSHFPEVEFAFAYGSGVIEQSGYNYQIAKKSASSDTPMVDFIFVVKDSQQWHQQNLERNPDHYSSLIPLKEKGIALVQDRIPAHFWFNAYVPFPSHDSQQTRVLMKYGVISEANAIKDLTNWSNLYLAGRLHKPVRILRSNPRYDELLLQNLEAAVKTSLLLLPEQFHEMDLYLSIAGLSYLGDIRMKVGAENPKKVLNLVTPIVDHYQKLYQSVFPRIPSFQKTENDSYQQDLSTSSKLALVSTLPLSLKSKLLTSNSQRERPPSVEEVKVAIGQIVSRSATMQSIKGLFTAGVVKSASYLLAKLAKRWK